MTRIGNLSNREKCKAYENRGVRLFNKKRKADKLARHLAKCKERHDNAED